MSKANFTGIFESEIDSSSIIAYEYFGPKIISSQNDFFGREMIFETASKPPQIIRTSASSEIRF